MRSKILLDTVRSYTQRRALAPCRQPTLELPSSGSPSAIYCLHKKHARRIGCYAVRRPSRFPKLSTEVRDIYSFTPLIKQMVVCFTLTYAISSMVYAWNWRTICIDEYVMLKSLRPNICACCIGRGHLTANICPSVQTEHSIFQGNDLAFGLRLSAIRYRLSFE
jgi:hypothetical protein